MSITIERNYLLFSEALDYLQIQEEDLWLLLRDKKIRLAVHPHDTAQFRETHRAEYPAEGTTFAPPPIDESIYPQVDATYFDSLPELPPFIYYFEEDAKQAEFIHGTNKGTSFTYSNHYQDFPGSKLLITKREEGGRYLSHSIQQILPAVFPLEELERLLQHLQQLQSKPSPTRQDRIGAIASVLEIKLGWKKSEKLPNESGSGIEGLKSQVKRAIISDNQLKSLFRNKQGSDFDYLFSDAWKESRKRWNRE